MREVRLRSAIGTCALCGAISWEGFKPDADVWMTHPYTRACLLSGITGPVRMFQSKNPSLGIPLPLAQTLVAALEESWEDACFQKSFNDRVKREIGEAIAAYKKWKKENSV